MKLKYSRNKVEKWPAAEIGEKESILPNIGEQ